MARTVSLTALALVAAQQPATELTVRIAASWPLAAVARWLRLTDEGIAAGRIADLAGIRVALVAELRSRGVEVA